MSFLVPHSEFPNFFLPLHSQHQAVETTADSQKPHPVAGQQKFSFICYGRGDRQGHRTDISKIFKGGKVS